MPKFKRNPAEVEAVRYTGDNVKAVSDLAGWDNVTQIGKGRTLIVMTREGKPLTLHNYEYIIKDAAGNLSTIQDYLFNELYTEVT